jgi:hypothetical protein
MSSMTDIWKFIHFARWDSLRKTIVPVHSIGSKDASGFHKLDTQIMAFKKNMESFANGGAFLHTLF